MNALQHEPSTGKHVVLFVDDDADFLAAQAAFFGKRGFRVLTAECGAAALRLLDEAVPDFIFLDLMMEHSDSGFVLGSRLRRDARLAEVPIVMLSGVAAAMGQRFDGEGAALQRWSHIDAFVDKPVHSADLLKIVQQRLDR
jgi:CheY-like chemotaxis protein